jgi:hypothetical protein
LEHAKLAKQAADDELLKLDKNKIAQLKGYKVPPTAVQGVFQAVVLLTGGRADDAKDWSASRKHVDLGFLHSLREFDVDDAMRAKKLGSKRARGIQTLLQKTGGEQAAERASIVALVLFRWVMACLQIYEALLQHAALQKEMEAQAEKEETDKARIGAAAEKHRQRIRPGESDGAAAAVEDDYDTEEHSAEHLVAEHRAKEAAARKIQGLHRGARAAR